MTWFFFSYDPCDSSFLNVVYIGIKGIYLILYGIHIHAIYMDILFSHLLSCVISLLFYRTLIDSCLQSSQMAWPIPQDSEGQPRLPLSSLVDFLVPNKHLGMPCISLASLHTPSHLIIIIFLYRSIILRKEKCATDFKWHYWIWTGISLISEFTPLIYYLFPQINLAGLCDRDHIHIVHYGNKFLTQSLPQNTHGSAKDVHHYWMPIYVDIRRKESTELWIFCSIYRKSARVVPTVYQSHEIASET